MDESYHIVDSQLSRLGNSPGKPGSTMELKTLDGRDEARP
jgi:hypothetical protein